MTSLDRIFLSISLLGLTACTNPKFEMIWEEDPGSANQISNCTSPSGCPGTNGDGNTGNGPAGSPGSGSGPTGTGSGSGETSGTGSPTGGETSSGSPTGSGTGESTGGETTSGSPTGSGSGSPTGSGTGETTGGETTGGQTSSGSPTGTGTGEDCDKPVQHEDRYQVSGSPKPVDILFVVDNSISMKKEHKKIAERFPRLAERLENIDWQIAMTTTDVVFDPNTEGPEDLDYNEGNLIPFVNRDQNGKKIPIGTKILKPTTPDFERAFRDTVKMDVVPIKKSPTRRWERGLVAAGMALTKNHPGFIRDGADLSIVIVSDANELNNKKWRRPESKAQGFLDTIIKPNFPDKNFTAHSIVALGGGFPGKNCNAERRGKEYILLSALTDGIVGSLCQDDFSQVLIGIGDRIESKAFPIHLACSPLNGDVDVELDPLPETPVVVNLNGSVVNLEPFPPVGTKIRLRYQCAP